MSSRDSRRGLSSASDSGWKIARASGATAFQRTKRFSRSARKDQEINLYTLDDSELSSSGLSRNFPRNRSDRVRRFSPLARAATRRLFTLSAVDTSKASASRNQPAADRLPWPIPRNLRARILSADRKCRTEREPGRGHRRRIVSRCLSVETFIAASANRQSAHLYPARNVFAVNCMFHRAFNIGGLEREREKEREKTCRKKLHLPRTAARRFSLYQEKNARKIQGSRAATREGRGEQWYKVNPIEYIIQYSAPQRAAMMSIAHDSAQ